MATLKVNVFIPDWVRWIAIDWDGAVRGYDSEPKPLGHSWGHCGRYRTILYKTKRPKNWKDELYTWS